MLKSWPAKKIRARPTGTPQITNGLRRGIRPSFRPKGEILPGTISCREAPRNVIAAKAGGPVGRPATSAWVLIFLLFLAMTVPAQEDVRYALEMNRLGAGVRAKGMGNAFVAADPEATHLYWNCAGIGALTNRELYFSHQELYGGLSSHTQGIAVIPLPSAVGIGIGYARFQDTGNHERYGEAQGTLNDRLTKPDMRGDGTPIGYGGNVQDELIVGTAKQYSIDLPRVAFYSIPAPLNIGAGASFKFYRNTFLLQDNREPARTMMGLNANMDLGMRVQLGLMTDPKTRAIERSVSVGGVIQDALETQVDYGTGYEETTQRVYRAGFSFLERADWIRGHLLVSVEIDEQYEKTDYFGVEYSYREMLALRAGLDDRNPSIGASLTHRYFRFDYAYSFHPLAATPLQMGLRIAF